MIKDNIIKYLPNALTLSNMTMGMIAIIFAVDGEYFIASLLILVGALFDRYDGKLARRFNSSSELGKEMDSLADMITFGVAPAIIALQFPLSNLNLLGYVIALLFVACGLYRLSRFNVSEIENTLKGLPITIAGSLLALSFAYQYTYTVYPLITAILMLIFSYLMISKYEIRKI